MKSFLCGLKISLSVVGAVCGAGFIGGAEIVKFFGREDYFFAALLCFIYLFLIFSVFFFAAARAKNLTLLNGEMFDAPLLVTGLIKAASLTVAACSLSAIKELAETVFPDLYPFGVFFSLFAVILITFSLKNGWAAVERVNTVIVPVLIILTVAACFDKSGNYTAQLKNPVPTMFLPLLYSFANCFLNLPVLFDAAKNKPKKTLIIAAALSSGVIALLAALIAANINAAYSYGNELPFSAAAGNGAVFRTAFLIAVITSLMSSYYPLCSSVGKKAGVYGKIFLGGAVFSLSLIGVNAIVSVFYPIIGAIGAAYIVKCGVYIVRLNKNRRIVNNNLKKGFNMKKKKQKVAKLSEEDYNRYIMSLKDEKPPMAIRKAQKEN